MSDKVTPETPWLGLSYFTEEDRGYFFGRTAELRELFERVVHKPLTILFGRSGLGKTSLVRAALVPLLREAGYTPVLVRLDHAETALPYERQVLAELLRALPVPPTPTPPPGLWEFFHDPAYGFVTAEGTASARPVLLFDQFEEIFTLGQARRDEAQAFRTALSGLVENRIPEPIRNAMEDDDALAERLCVSLRPCKVLLSLREDFLHELERWRHVMPSLMDNRLELRLLTGPQALEAAVEPGRLRCAARPDLPPIVSPETGAAIVRFIAGAQDDAPLAEIDAVPPLLSLLCAELNAQRGESPVIQPGQLGGRAEDILAEFYGRCFAAHPPAVRRFVEDRLLSPEGFRQSANHDAFLHEMRGAGLPGEEASRILGRLVDDRLLVSEERGGIHRIELTHDILTGLARSSRDARQAREAGEKRRRQRQRLAIVATSLALLAAAISVPLMLWALSEKHQGDIALRKSDALLWEASKSDSEESTRKLADGDWNTAVAYGARALRIRPENAEAARRLFGHTLLAAVAPSQILAHDGPITHARFLPDGAALLTVTLGRTLRRWESADGQRWSSREIFTAEKGEKIVAVSPAGDRLCLLAADGSARLWDVSARAAGPTLGDTKPSAAVFSPDGRHLLTMSGTGPLTVWDAPSGQKLESPTSEGDAVTAAGLAPDGSRLLTGTKTGAIRCWKSAGDGAPWEMEWALEDALKEGVPEIAISPDGSRFATVGGDGAAACWSMPYRFQVASLQGEQLAACVAYSEDGSMLATGGIAGSVQLWERASGKPLAFLRGHRGWVTAVSFSADGRFLLSASADGTARIWEMARSPLDAPGLSIGEAVDSGKIPAAPGWVYESLLPFLCGKELDREGKISELTVERQLAAQAVVEERIEAVRTDSGNSSSPWERFLSWKFLSDSRTRLLIPDSTMTGPAFVEQIYAIGRLTDERSLRAAWLAAPSDPLAQWALGKTHAGGAWGVWLQERALRRLADPSVVALYGAESVARWAKARAAVEASETLPSTVVTNSLGMKFAPVAVSGGKTVLFSVWETRVRDYEQYAVDQAGVDETWKDLTYKGHQVYSNKDKNCPVAAVSWHEANKFCDWLTKRERALGKITSTQRYRLPTDEEWSWAAGIGEEEEEALHGRSPKDKDSKVGAYPWGTLKYPPLDENGKPLGNYADSEFKKAFPEGYAIDGFTDGFATSSPVETYPAGAHGLYDMGGNAAEWCADWYDPADRKSRVVRGASWFSYGPTGLLSSYRGYDQPGVRNDDFGFRCVLAEDSSAAR